MDRGTVAGGAADRAVKVVHVHRIRGIGGSERHLLTLLPALAERGVDVTFVGLDDPAGVLEPFYRELTVPFERLAAPRDLDPALAYRLARTLRSFRPDVVHTHLVHADVYGVLAPGRRIISTKHNPDPFRAGAFRFAERALTWRASRVIAISEAVKRFSVEEVGLPPNKIEVVHYGLDELPRPWAENPPLELEGPLLLAVCRLEKQKGLETALRALADMPGATLLVLGEGPERPALESLASSLGVPDRVLLPGRVGDVAPLYARADVVVHPARWEGFGLAMLEAMLAARPVVAARAGSAPELVDDGRTGVLVPVDDAAALADAVSSLLADPHRAEQLGRAGLERARTEFSVARMAERTMALYESVCENPHMGILDKIKGWFAGDDTAARDERGGDTAESNEPHGETSGDITGKATDTEVARSVGETNPADAERLSDPDAS